MPKYLYIAALAIMIASGCSEGKHEKAALERPRVSGVTLITAGEGTVAGMREIAATVKSTTTSTVAARTMGAILNVNVREGDRVRKGDLLLTIDDRDFKAKTSAAEEAVNEARRALASATEQKTLASKTYERYKKLFEQKALSSQELETFETQKNVADNEYERVAAMARRAEAGLEEARLWQGYARVTAPTGGIITARIAEPGSMASPGMPLVVIDDDSVFRAEAAIDESLLHEVGVGRKFTVEIPSINARLDGTVVEVVPAIDPGSRTFIAKLSIYGKGLRSGQYARIFVKSGARQALTVPTSAIVERGQLTGIYVVGEGNIVTYRLVRLGRDYGQTVEIVSGLRPGERVIVEGADKAADGAVLENPPAPAR